MTRKRRTRRPAGHVAEAPRPQPASEPETRRPPLPQWHWRTFPVFFAFSLAAFLGVYIGSFTGYSWGRNGNLVPTQIALAVTAVLLGFGVARLAVVGLMRIGIIRPQPKK